jgi:RimJ/RimL family protein N-acetyltransferase
MTMTSTPEIAGHIRKIWPQERDQFRGHLLRLDAESRANRFNTVVSDRFIEQYSQRALRADSIVHGYFIDGVLRGCAELRGFRSRSAEAAFSIELSFQNNGVGSSLMGRTILTARNRGIKTLYMNCLSHNHPMQAIARKYRADLKFEAGDVMAEITNAQPDPLSIFREFVADSCSFGNAILDAQTRLLRAA